MSKKSSEAVSASAHLFGSPVPIEPKSVRKTILVVPVKDKDGTSVKHVCIEDLSKDQIPLHYEEVTLSNLRDKGVEPHALVGKIDSQRIGIDAGIDSLATHIINNAGQFVVVESKSE